MPQSRPPCSNQYYWFEKIGVSAETRWGGPPTGRGGAACSCYITTDPEQGRTQPGKEPLVCACITHMPGAWGAPCECPVCGVGEHCRFWWGAAGLPLGSAPPGRRGPPSRYPQTSPTSWPGGAQPGGGETGRGASLDNEVRGSTHTRRHPNHRGRVCLSSQAGGGVSRHLPRTWTGGGGNSCQPAELPACRRGCWTTCRIGDKEQALGVQRSMWLGGSF